MPGNFYMQRAIPKWGKDTYVNWSINPANKAVVFIHGFSGSSLATFGDFNIEFRALPEYKGYDVYFYQYDSMRSQIENNAVYFLDFLKSINEDLESIIANSGINLARERTPYTRIVIVAHSLGAVVTRIALNDGHANNETWLDKCELILFAPAHNGAHKSINRLIDLPGPLKILGKLIESYYVSINQLTDPSIIIQPMIQNVRDLIEKNDIKTFTIAKMVIWADPDLVVVNKRFLSDPIARSFQFARKGHQAICKPTKKFREPIKLLASIL